MWGENVLCIRVNFSLLVSQCKRLPGQAIHQREASKQNRQIQVQEKTHYHLFASLTVLEVQMYQFSIMRQLFDVYKRS
jgi:hypothetical protein